MITPKTTEFSLKRIVENLNKIPSNGFGPEPKRLSLEEKRQLKEMAAQFNEYGKAFENEQAIMDSAKAIALFMELAETYAVNEGQDWFQTEIVKRDFQDAKKKVQNFQKIAQECYARKQQLGVAFDDLRHIVNRYYEIQECGIGMEGSPTPPAPAPASPEVPVAPEVPTV
jgi:cell fate (sporulation/competence/biofilm development) regulator YlbF (YheA/YmcA/DUF963 family)